MTDDLISPDGLPRCFGNRPGQEILAHYHDTEWGVPVHNDKHLFEMLTLEGAQAGLSWDVVLRKRAGYKMAFHDFDLRRVAAMTDSDLEALLKLATPMKDPAVADAALRTYEMVDVTIPYNRNRTNKLVRRPPRCTCVHKSA